MRRIKMDRDVGKNTGVYHEIMTGSVTVFLALVDLYCTLFNNTVEEKILKSIENVTARKALLFVLYFIVFNILYWLVLEAVFYFKEKSWAKRHKDLWMRGKWLHIHIKTDNAIRIGMVDIQQNFYEIKVDAMNVSYLKKKGSTTTKWGYYSAKLSEESGTPNMIGCYKSIKEGMTMGNQGIHSLFIKNRDKKSQYPIELSGMFSDTFKMEKKNMEPVHPGDHCGKLMLFRLSKKMENTLYRSGHLNIEKLRTIDQDVNYADEPFVKELKELKTI